jgi:DNA-directed RNA polymerase beta subunit
VYVQGTKVFLNGRWIGVHRNADELKKALLKLRRAESISNDVSIVYDHSLNEIRVNNDWGRVCRPLFVVEGSKIELTKQEVKQIKVCTCCPPH